MPGRDGTGPLGNGPLTGWGRGNCADDEIRQNRGFGFGFGRGRGRGFGAAFGFGRGLGWRWNVENQTETDESSLKSSIDFLKNQLKVLEDRLNSFRSK
jgi:hypothetical protein